MVQSRLLADYRERILELARRHGARNVRVFGSIARGEETPTSDVDLLVEFLPGRTLLDQAKLLDDLEDLLGRRVDLLADGGVSPYLHDRIYAEARPL